jgi:1-acyl-sn-glycerol-3-phosphate acyltransferase
MPPRMLARKLWHQFLKSCLQLAGVSVYQVRFSGIRNIPASGGVLVVCNHQSHLDPMLVGIGVPRQMNYLARRSLFSFGPFGRLLSSVSAIPVEREGVGLSGIKESLRRLKRGEMLVIFPEGTRSEDGEISPFRPGFTMLAVRTGAAILPVAIEGTYDVWPRTRRFPRVGPGAIHVRYGEPLRPQQYAPWDESRLLCEVERRVRQCQAELRGHPDFAGRTWPRPPAQSCLC